MQKLWAVALLLVLVASPGQGTIPATDACRRYSTSCDLCADFIGCYWCGQPDGSAQCVENFATITTDCPLLVLTRSFCTTDGLSFTPPPASPYELSLGSSAGLATLYATSVLVLVLFILSCMTFTFCPVKCGSSPAWCCGGCSKLYRWC